MSKHTKGPWSVPHFARDSTTCMCTYVFSDYQSGFGSIASVPFGGEDECIETAKANARLIAAAPDLLEALQDLKREIVLSDVDMDYIDSHFKKWLDKARAAIDKATIIQ